MCAERRRPGRSPRNPREPVREAALDPPNNSGQWRGAVRVIKCKLCPTARFSRLRGRYISTNASRDPSRLRSCGDYFGRRDSGVFHHKDKKYQEACLDSSQHEAREKKQKVEWLLRVKELNIHSSDSALSEAGALSEECLRNGEDIEPLMSGLYIRATK